MVNLLFNKNNIKNLNNKTKGLSFSICLLLFAILLLLPQARALAATTNQISQFGITWTFDKEYEYGQFANGDYWVVGSVTITSISPGWDGEKHGSMVNPIPIAPGKQAYDSRHGSYDASLRVDAPVTLNPNSSLISAISWIIGEEGCPILVGGTPRPMLKTAAVLTVLGSIPPNNGVNVFRPPYSGSDKPIYSTSALRKDLLPNLALVSSTPNIQSMASNFERVWLDHFAHHGDGIQYTSPTENMPNYGSYYSIEVGEASLMLMLNETELIRQQGSNKDKLLIRLVQIGIDLYGIVENGGYWWTGGGLNSGRKWPILFAGLMLDHPGMKNIGTRSQDMPYLGFQEDGQTFYVNQSNVDYSHSAAWTPDPRGDIMPYEVSDIGLPEWGGIRRYEPWNANKAWNTPYRDCCTALGYPGYVLAVHIMGQKEAWNHDALFDYTDRWVKVQNQYYTGSEANRGYYVYGGNFQRDMWDTYRADYGCVWTRNDPYDLYSQGHYVDCQTTFLYGDVSGDGSITAYDAALAAQAAVGLITLTADQTKAADVSGDGEVSAYDAALIAQRAVGLISKFPVEP